MSTDGCPFAALIASSDLSRQIEIDEANVRFHAKQKAELERAAWVLIESKRLAENTDGFAEQFEEPRSGKVTATLVFLTRINGKIASRRDHARRLVAEGCIVTLSRGNEGRKVIKPDGSYLTEKQLTKTVVDYIAWLETRR